MDEEYTFKMPNKSIKYVAKYYYARLHLQMLTYDGTVHYESPINAGQSVYNEIIYKCQIGDTVPVQVRRNANNSPYLEGLYDQDGNLLTNEYRYNVEITGEDMYIVAKWKKEFAIGQRGLSYTSLLTTIDYKAKSDSEFAEFPSNGRANLIIGETYILKAKEVEGYDFVGWYDYDLAYLKTPNYEFEFEMGVYTEHFFPLYERTITIEGLDGESYSDMHCTIKYKANYYNDSVLKEINEDGTFKIMMGDTFDLIVSSVEDGYSFYRWYSYDGNTTISTTTSAQIKDDGSILGYKISVRETT